MFITALTYLFPWFDATADLFEYKWQPVSVFQVQIFYYNATCIRPVIRWPIVLYYPLSLYKQVIT